MYIRRLVRARKAAIYSVLHQYHLPQVRVRMARQSQLSPSV